MEEINLIQSMLESKEKIINIYKSIAQDMRELNALLQLPEKPIMKRKSTKKIPLLHQSNISPVPEESKLVSTSAKILVIEEPFSVSFLTFDNPSNTIDIISTVILDTTCDTSTSAITTTTSDDNTNSYTYNDMNFIDEEDDFYSEEDFLTSENYDFATFILEPFLLQLLLLLLFLLLLLLSYLMLQLAKHCQLLLYLFVMKKLWYLLIYHPFC